MKAINTKKIVALTTGLAMVGATIFGAAAQDLSQYPTPLFIKDGAFDGAIVVGELAKTSDVIGSIELAAGLQTAAVKTTTLAVGPGSSSIDKGVKIDKTGTHLTLGSVLADIQDTPLDDSDLPDLLADQTYDEDEGATKNKVDYTQEITLGATSGELIFTQDDDDAPTAGAYLHFDDSDVMYTYELQFDEDVEYDDTDAASVNDDFESSKLNILGKDYTVTEATDASGIDKLVMLAGDTTRWMTQDEPLEREINGAKHTFTLVDVNENEDKCGISVDGTVQWIDKGSTKTIGGIEIGVSDAITVHSAGKDTDVCEVNLGATELTLEDGNEVQLNGVDIDGSTVTFDTSAGILSGFTIDFQPEDEVFLAKGQHYVEPVFDSFAYYFDGMNTQKTEAITMDAGGSNADLKFLNSDGKEVKLGWKLNSNVSEDLIYLGKGPDIDERTYVEGEACDFITSIKECEGARFFLITAGGEAHVIKLTNFDTTDDKIKVQDETYGSTSEDDFDGTSGGAQSVSLGSGAGSITLTSNAGDLTFTEISGNSNLAETSLNDEGGVDIADQTTTGIDGDVVAQLTEETEDGFGGSVIDLTLSFDTNDEDISVDAPDIDTAWVAAGVDASDTDNDHSYYVTDWTTSVYYDNDQNTFAHIEYPDEYRYGQAFVGEAEAKVSSAGGLIQGVEIQQIPVGSAKLDKDISDVGAQNLIVVGGPCANSVAASLMGNPADCAEGFKEGEGIIKLYKASSGKVAVLAAGYSALDTRRVTRVLSNFKEYASQLKGTEVKVKGTTLTDVTIEAVA
ncbi:MAG TPA: hypothetical protein VLJ21_05425 [Candidatus Binatia bacterium]|nr:hypothetical protein [Candidatus Binatia bacterium]